MNNNRPVINFKLLYSEMTTDASRIEWLKQEVKRVKIERNEFEQSYFKMKKQRDILWEEVQHLEAYINRKNTRHEQ